MKKTLLLTIAALITAWSAMAQSPLQFGGGWQTGETDVIYAPDDVINIKISGTGENEFDCLHLSPGTLSAGGAQLNVFLCSAPTPGDRFVIFKTQSVVGKFSNPQIMNVGGYYFVLSYDNDETDELVVLTAVAKTFNLTIKRSGTELDAPDEDRITQWDTYNVNVVADPVAGGTVSVTHATFKVCDEIGIQVTENLGYAFTHWTQEGGAIIANTASPTTTATMPARDVTITANFEYLLPEAPTANDEIVCYDGTEHSADATPPLYSSIVWYDDATGTVTTTAPTGTEPGTYKAWAASKHIYTGKESEARTEVTLTINALPEMECPDDYDVCIDDPAFELLGATPAGGTYSGPGVSDGNFDPATADVGKHTISYSYTNPDTGCKNTCTFTVTVDPLPTGTITDPTPAICENSTYTVPVGTATATNYDAVLWSHDGEGTLNNETTFTPTYNSVAGDAGNNVILTMVVTGTGACGTVTVTTTNRVTITVDPMPTAAITDPEEAICVGSSYTVPVSTATATHYSAVLWSHDGAGSLTNEDSFTPTYNSVAGDAGNNVILTMEVTGDGECGTVTVTATSQVTITVDPLPDPPTVLPADGITTNTFTANWEEVPGALNYTLQVALDDGFSDFVDGYEDLEVVGTTSHTVVGLDPGTTYYYRVKATDACGTSTVSNTVNVRTDCVTSTITDIDNNVYQTVIIGDQEWMAENLRVTRYNNGDDIPTGSDADWSSGAYAIYPHEGGETEGNVEGINSDEEMVAAYGKLYNWYAVIDDRGLCPEGWSVPSDDDWTQLVDYVVSEGFPNNNVTDGAGNALKSCRQVDHPDGGDCDTSEHPRWNSHSTNSGFDEFCFSALPGGYRSRYSRFYSVGNITIWWSASEHSDTNAIERRVRLSDGHVGQNSNNKACGFSVRCFRDID